MNNVSIPVEELKEVVEQLRTVSEFLGSLGLFNTHTSEYKVDKAVLLLSSHLRKFENTSPADSPEVKLASAKVMLKVAVAYSNGHGEGCPAGRFWQSNKHLPSNHPAWRSAPECDCWVRDVKAFLKSC
jgi:hypothetical protein